MPTQPVALLLVEDNQMYAEMIAELAQNEWPFAERVTIVGSLAETLACLSHIDQWPDMILLDLRLPLRPKEPGYSMGLATLDAVMDSFPTTRLPPPVVVLTGDIAVDEIALLEHGAVDVQRKGGLIAWGELQQRMRREWAKHQRSRQILERLNATADER